MTRKILLNRFNTTDVFVQKRTPNNSVVLESGPLQEDCYHNNCITKLSHEQDLVITPDEVCEVFKTLNTNKSPGPDGIPSKVLKGLLGNNFFIDSVAKLFTFCLNCEKISSIWKIAYVIPIHKGGF